MKNAYGLLFSIFFCTTFCYSDFLLLRNSQSTETKIVDTTGCNITILRNGNKVKIAKDLIDFIVIGGRDTIHYTTYICNAAPKQFIQLQNTPEYQILSIINNTNFPQSDKKIETGSTIAFLPFVLQGRNDTSMITSFRSMLQSSGSNLVLQDVTKDTLAAILKGQATNCRYAFVIKRMEDVVSGYGKSNDGSSGNTPGIYITGDVTTIGEVILLDLTMRKMVFSSIVTEKRELLNMQPGLLEKIIMSIDNKENTTSSQKDYVKDANSQRVTEKLLKKIKKYLQSGEE